jgi:hypothetical protein
MHAKDKFIAFVDILGFSALIEAAEQDDYGNFSRPLELIEALWSAADANRRRERVSGICPSSRHVACDLDYQLTQISDCIVISAEVSPAGIINLVQGCFWITLSILKNGAQCRGFITRGNVYHRDGNFMGTGYMRACKNESSVSFMRANDAEQGTPFIQVDDVVSEYVRNETDECVRKMFGRMTRSDGTYVAIYPFDQLGKVPSALVRQDFNPNYWKEALQRSLRLRQTNLATFEEAERKAVDEGVKQKIRHYKRGLEEVIQRLRDKEAALDEMIATGKIPIGMVW